MKNAAISTLVGATLVFGVITLAPGWGEDGPRREPGAAERALAAAGAGAPAALVDLTALIYDREEWVRTHPRDEESWAVLGSAYVERGSRLADPAYYRKADSALRRSLELLPGQKGNVNGLVGLAALANARHNYAEARTLGQSAMKQQPNRWTPYPALIDAYSGLGDYKAMSKAMDKLTELHPGAQTLSRAAVVYRKLGRREDAAAMAYDAVGSAQAPQEKAAARQLLGDLAWERGEPAEALTEYEAALRLAPDDDPVLASRARALAALGRTDEALRDYQAALDRVERPEYALAAGELYQSLGLDGDAATQYDQLRTRVERAGADDVVDEVVLGLFEADHGDPGSAVRRLKAEWARGHLNMNTADALGWALYRAGRPEEALPYARRASEQGLRSALFAYHRGEIERALKQDGPARRHLTEALGINPYFSPLLAPAARRALDSLGEPPPGGPKDVTGPDWDGVTEAEPETETETEPETEAPTLSPSPTPWDSPSLSPTLSPTPTLSQKPEQPRAGAGANASAGAGASAVE
ncbi:transcriptional activator [Streptomyces sp. SLBN-118]|nr:transcriptional activator [Streptomyces sp. SLBN-118]